MAQDTPKDGIEIDETEILQNFVEKDKLYEKIRTTAVSFIDDLFRLTVSGNSELLDKKLNADPGTNMDPETASVIGAVIMGLFNDKEAKEEFFPKDLELKDLNNFIGSAIHGRNPKARDLMDFVLLAIRSGLSGVDEEAQVKKQIGLKVKQFAKSTLNKWSKVLVDDTDEDVDPLSRQDYRIKANILGHIRNKRSFHTELTKQLRERTSMNMFGFYLRKFGYKKAGKEVERIMIEVLDEEMNEKREAIVSRLKDIRKEYREANAQVNGIADKARQTVNDTQQGVPAVNGRRKTLLGLPKAPVATGGEVRSKKRKSLPGRTQERAGVVEAVELGLDDIEEIPQSGPASDEAPRMAAGSIGTQRSQSGETTVIPTAGDVTAVDHPTLPDTPKPAQSSGMMDLPQQSPKQPEPAVADPEAAADSLTDKLTEEQVAMAVEIAEQSSSKEEVRVRVERVSGVLSSPVVKIVLLTLSLLIFAVSASVLIKLFKKDSKKGKDAYAQKTPMQKKAMDPSMREVPKEVMQADAAVMGAPMRTAPMNTAMKAPKPTTKRRVAGTPPLTPKDTVKKAPKLATSSSPHLKRIIPSSINDLPANYPQSYKNLVNGETVNLDGRAVVEYMRDAIHEVASPKQLRKYNTFRKQKMEPGWLLYMAQQDDTWFQTEYKNSHRGLYKKAQRLLRHYTWLKKLKDSGRKFKKSQNTYWKYLNEALRVGTSMMEGYKAANPGVDPNNTKSFNFAPNGEVPAFTLEVMKVVDLEVPTLATKASSEVDDGKVQFAEDAPTKLETSPDEDQAEKSIDMVMSKLQESKDKKVAQVAANEQLVDNTLDRVHQRLEENKYERKVKGRQSYVIGDVSAVASGTIGETKAATPPPIPRDAILKHEAKIREQEYQRKLRHRESWVIGDANKSASGTIGERAAAIPPPIPKDAYDIPTGKQDLNFFFSKEAPYMEDIEVEEIAEVVPLTPPPIPAVAKAEPKKKKGWLNRARGFFKRAA